MFFWLCRILLWLPAKIFYPTKIVGRKNLKKTKSILVCNHLSNFDPFLVFINTRFVFHTLAKKELFKNKLGNWAFTHMHCIPVDRKSNDISAIKSSIKVLKEKNKPLLIFPSGKRTEQENEFDELKNGASMLAFKTGAEIIPMMFNRKPKIFRRTKIYVGEPINMEQFKDENKTNAKIYEEITQTIKEKMNNLITNN